MDNSRERATFTVGELKISVLALERCVETYSTGYYGYYTIGGKPIDLENTTKSLRKEVIDKAMGIGSGAFYNISIIC